ncbi:hypothetical protein ABK040_002253 [Willaertia magna]
MVSTTRNQKKGSNSASSSKGGAKKKSSSTNKTPLKRSEALRILKEYEEHLRNEIAFIKNNPQPLYSFYSHPILQNEPVFPRHFYKLIKEDQQEIQQPEQSSSLLNNNDVTTSIKTSEEIIIPKEEEKEKILTNNNIQKDEENHKMEDEGTNNNLIAEQESIKFDNNIVQPSNNNKNQEIPLLTPEELVTTETLSFINNFDYPSSTSIVNNNTVNLTQIVSNQIVEDINNNNILNGINKNNNLMEDEKSIEASITKEEEEKKKEEEINIIQTEIENNKNLTPINIENKQEEKPQEELVISDSNNNIVNEINSTSNIENLTTMKEENLNNKSPNNKIVEEAVKEIVKDNNLNNNKEENITNNVNKNANKKVTQQLSELDAIMNSIPDVPEEVIPEKKEISTTIKPIEKETKIEDEEEETTSSKKRKTKEKKEKRERKTKEKKKNKNKKEEESDEEDEDFTMEENDDEEEENKEEPSDEEEGLTPKRRKGPTLEDLENEKRKKELEEVKRKEDELLLTEEKIKEEIKEMQKKGLWMPQSVGQKVGKEPKRNRTHWDFLLKEMEYIAKDFHEEQKWKLSAAKKNAKSVAKYHQQLIQQEIKKKKEIEQNLKKQASKIAKMVKKEFWDKILKIVKFKNQSKIDETKQQLLAEKRDILVNQTEKFTQMISQDMLSFTTTDNIGSSSTSTPITPMTPTMNGNNTQEESTKAASSQMQASMEIDEKPKEKEEEIQQDVSEENEVDFDPSNLKEDENDDVIELTDDEEEEDYEDEIEMLQRESQMDLGDVIKSYSNTQDSEINNNTQMEEEISQTESQTSLLIEPQTSTNETEIDDEGKLLLVSDSAKEFQPTGITLATSKIKTDIPFLLSEKLILREYQRIGLDWLITMHDKGLNGILADEMGLGKTIMTISLIAHLACRGAWGPHLVVVPSSVLLNWEIEFKRWCPSLKILSYYGSQKERKKKRVGWNKPNTFHVCITSYNLVVQDKAIFRRKQWYYLILDEAHHIRNFKSQAWQTLLNFNTKKRLLLTGTPLQNNVMELWSLMHFLMPQLFQSHSEFKDWFSNSIQGMVEGKQEMNRELIARLHTILRPFILRRLKKEVAAQLPSKQEHVVRVRLSKRQRFLYEDFMSKTETRGALSSGNVFKMINIVMQLRKVCNHPDLFEPRPIVSPFSSEQLELNTIPVNFIQIDDNFYRSEEYQLGLPFTKILSTLKYYGLIFTSNELSLSMINYCQTQELKSTMLVDEDSLQTDEELKLARFKLPGFKRYAEQIAEIRRSERRNRIEYMERVNAFRSDSKPIYGFNLLNMLSNITKEKSIDRFHNPNTRDAFNYCKTLKEMCKSVEERSEEMTFELDNFVCFIPKARSDPPYIKEIYTRKLIREKREKEVWSNISPTLDAFRKPNVRMQMQFPDKRLLQFDCGKLVKMASMLKDLKRDGHRVLIFTQMSKMLDVLESFLSMHGHTYFRLDGQTKLEERQYMMEKFNNDSKIFAFILSTRSGGLGINLTGADTVIFYDSDWNPAMDAQAQDRCHRIGQTRNVNIYRLISESTIEERILLKANQKRHMNEIVIHNGGFTPEFLKNQMEVRDLLVDSFNGKSFSDTLQENERQMQAYNSAMEKQTSSEDNVEYSQKDLERMLSSVEDENDVVALKNVRKEQSEFSNEFADADAEDEDGDIINQLTPVERFGFNVLSELTLNAVEQEIEEIKEQERLKAETWKNELMNNNNKMEDEEQVIEEEEENEKKEVLKEENNNEENNNEEEEDKDEENDSQLFYEVGSNQSQQHHTDTHNNKRSTRGKKKNTTKSSSTSSTPRRSTRKKKKTTHYE